MNLYSLENLKCPECGNDLATEEIVLDLCGDPYNGIIVECDECETELSLDIRVMVTEL